MRFPEIPDTESHRETMANIEAFREVLRKYFAEYPVPQRMSCDAARYRGFALDRKRAREACFYAVDVGVPNELVMASYTLLFL